MKVINTTAILLFTLLFLSCTRSFEPFEYGKEACAHCKMTIVDPRYSAEFIDKKGKVFKFDDIACMRNFISENNIQETGLEIFVSGYLDNKELDAKKAVYIQNDYFKSPMKGNTAAFRDQTQAAKLLDSLHTETKPWSDLKF
jgi:copper chaperone NosL